MRGQIIEAQPHPVIAPEVVLGQIAMQMLLAAMPVDAAHAPLEDAEVALGAVGVDVVADVLAGRVRHRLMRRELGPDLGA